MGALVGDPEDPADVSQRHPLFVADPSRLRAFIDATSLARSAASRLARTSPMMAWTLAESSGTTVPGEAGGVDVKDEGNGVTPIASACSSRRAWLKTPSSSSIWMVHQLPERVARAV